MKSNEIVEKFLKYYGDLEHKLIPNVSLVPQNDPTLLFVNSGMFPLVPYLSGEPHPLGKRLMNIQRSIRFDDLKYIGDYIHTLAFHMIGNWSLGDYFKEDQLTWKFDFLINHLELDPKLMVATVFKGDKDAPKDEESIKILKKVFGGYGIDAKEGELIWAYSKEEGNWWQRGDVIGELGGPNSEVFYYLGNGIPRGKSPIDNEEEFVELGNSVFMEYKKAESGWEKLSQSNVDFGGGLERIAMAVQGKKDIFETDNFYPLIQKIEEISGKKYASNEGVTFAMRNIADHIRGSVFLAMDGVLPSNKDQGYVLRKLLRRMVRFSRKINIEGNISVALVPVVAETVSWIYPDLMEKQESIKETFSKEEKKFKEVLERGHVQSTKKLIKYGSVGGDADKLLVPKDAASIAFELFQSSGYPLEEFKEDAKDLGIEIGTETDELFEDYVRKHQELSRKGAEQKFKGGLADQSESTIRYHTATHVLHMALRQVLGEQVIQKGSNITKERLRFDFPHLEKLSEKQIQEIEKIIENTVEKAYPVNFEMLSITEAEKTGAIHAFGEKYGDDVKVYYIGGSLETAISKEFCGGPHVPNTKELLPLDIYKQKSIGKGVLRIYAKFKDKSNNLMA